MAYYLALYVDFFLKQQLITKGAVFIGPPDIFILILIILLIIITIII